MAALRATRGVAADTSARLLQGQILTPSGEPLVGASILFPGTTQGTVTGMDGAFSIQAPPGQQSFTVTYAGYKTATIPISRQDSFRITLEEGAPLSEVVVTDLNRAKTSERSLAAPKMLAAPPTAIPQGGFPNLEKYIRENLQYPEEAQRQGVEGIVLLQFTVRPDGNLIQFKVLQSPGHGCDKEAIRLLEKGPKWEAPNGQEPVITTYPVRFELE
jgi:TonB family protein